MTSSMSSGIKSITDNSKTGSQRLPSVPILPADMPESLYWDAPPGTFFANEADSKVFLQLDATTTIDLTAGGTIPIDDISGSQIRFRSIPGDRIKSESLIENEFSLGNTVSGAEFPSLLLLPASWTVSSPGEGLDTLTLNIPFGSDDNIFLARSGGAQKFRVGPTSVAVGVDIPDSAFSIFSDDEDQTLLRGRGRGGVFNFTDEFTGDPVFTVDRFGNTFVKGSLSAEGLISAQEGVSVEGALTGVSQFNVIGGLEVGGTLTVTGPTFFGDQVTFSGDPLLLPSNYAARVGSNVWMRTLSNPNRIVLEGVSDSSVAEVQLGTGGPVLSGAFATSNEVRVDGNKLLTSLPGGLLGSQIAFDTLTGGATAGQGNIAAATVDSYNLKDASIVRSNLSAGAVGTLQIADGSIPSGKIVDFAISKLLSGTLDADEVYMGPHGTIYMGPVDHAHITDQRVQLNAEGMRSYNVSNNPVAEVLPASFSLRSALTGARLALASDSGLTLYAADNSVTAQLATTGVFSLTSKSAGTRAVLDSQAGMQFIAAPTRNAAYNPGFKGGSGFVSATNCEATDDQQHVFAGEYAVRTRALTLVIATPSYVEVPFKNSVGTSSSFSLTRTNACINPSLANDAAGWSAVVGASSGARIAAVGFPRTNVLKLTVAATGAGTVLAPVATSVVAGQQWTLSCNARVSLAQSITPSIQWINASDVVISETAATAIACRAGVVERVWVTATAPANAVKLRLKLSLAMVTGDILEVSNALYERTSGIDDYVDGATPGWTWSGTVGASASNMTPVLIPGSTSNLVSIFVWSDVACWTQIEGRDASNSRGVSDPTRLIAGQWTRVYVACTGVIDRVRLLAPTSDAGRTVRLGSYLWYSAVQVERDRTLPTPFCSGSEPGCYWEGAPANSASLRDQDTVTAQLTPALGVTVSGAVVGGSITASNFVAGLVIAADIRGSTVKGSTLIGTKITGDQIVTNTLNGDRIQANTLISNVSLQTGVVGRRILLSGPDNSIKFFPAADESRYSQLYSYIPTGLPNDISVELKSIDSSAVTMISRLRIQPDEAFIGLTASANNASLKGGVVVCTDELAYVGIKVGPLEQQGGGSSGLLTHSTSEINLDGWFRNGPWSAEQAVLHIWLLVPPNFGGTNYSIINKGFTMASDLAPINAGTKVAGTFTNAATDIESYIENLTRTSMTLRSTWATGDGQVEVQAWVYRKQP